MSYAYLFKYIIIGDTGKIWKDNFETTKVMENFANKKKIVWGIEKNRRVIGELWNLFGNIWKQKKSQGYRKEQCIKTFKTILLCWAPFFPLLGDYSRFLCHGWKINNFSLLGICVFSLYEPLFPPPRAIELLLWYLMMTTFPIERGGLLGYLSLSM